MALNHPKTRDILMHDKTTKPDSPLVQDIIRKCWLKVLGSAFQENPSCWDLHFGNLSAKARSRPYTAILRKVVGKSARDNPVWVILSKLFFKEI